MGASVIAVSPVTVPPPDVHAIPLPVAQRIVTLPEVQLASLSEDLTGVVGQLVSPVPGDLDEYDFLDAAVLTGQNLAFQSFRLVALPPLVVVLLLAGAPPEQLAAVVVGSYLALPTELAKPWAAALANVLPAPLGGVPEEDSSVPGQGVVFDTWHSANDALTGLLAGIFLPNQQLAVNQAGVTTTDRTGPPAAGRPLDAVRHLVARAIEFPVGGPNTAEDGGSNASSAVKEVRETVKDLRQVVREAVKDTVKAAASLGKKDEEKKQDPTE